MNLADWAASVGVNRHTAYRWFREGTLPVPAQRVGRLILVKTSAASLATSGVVVYARVSSHDQRADLDRQVARLTAWATDKEFEVAQVVCEVGSGLNGKRPKLRRILSDPDARVIVVEPERGRVRVFDNSFRRRDGSGDGVDGDNRGQRNRAMCALTAAKTHSTATVSAMASFLLRPRGGRFVDVVTRFLA